MKFREIYKETVEKLSSQTQDAEFEAMCLMEKVFGITRTQYYLKADEEAEAYKCAEMIKYSDRRVSGEPLQYILGQWEFMGRTFLVGKGVLIPRPETEMIVEAALDFIKDKTSPIIFDLCSGSGCIGISIAATRPDSTVYLLEKSRDALFFLRKNIQLNNTQNIHVLEGDIFSDFNIVNMLKPDLIVSNPPYIESDTIPFLQKEVLEEPRMALDGGKDGLDFYRAISEHWIPLLNINGAVIVECGENQGERICGIFKQSNRIKSASYKLDYNGNERMVSAQADS